MLWFLFNEVAVAGHLTSNITKKRLQHRCEYSKISKNTYFEVETVESEIYSCFLMSEVIYSLL